MTKVLDKAKIPDMLEYARNCALLTDVDFNKVYNDCINTVRYYQGAKEARFEMTHPLKLQEYWYESLERGNPDYSVYNGAEMLSDMWACWKIYSREYLKSMVSPKSMPYIDEVTGKTFTKAIKDDMSVKHVLDLGCGIGYTTAALAEIFPNAKVYGTNVKFGYQVEIARCMSTMYKFNLVHELSDVPQVDLVFASEYFEHFEDPVSHLKEVLNLNPKYMIMANAFSAQSVGHFNQYYYEGVKYDAKSYGRIFNKFLRAEGFLSVKTNCYNNRPTYWKKGI